MKKLILVVTIVCTAVIAQAGSVKWNLADVTSPTDGYAYLLNSDDVSFADVNTVIAAISAGTFGTLYGTTAAKTASFDVDGISLAGAITGISGDTTLWMIAVDNVADPTKVFVGEEITKKIGSSGSQNYSWAYGDNTTAWTAVPEPTSGMLLLLGVAGLALRRRRA